jgi:hypothetical protein
LSGTLLDGEADPVTVTGVRNIHVNLGDGNDLVAVVGANIRGNLSVRAGVGDDRVLVGTGEGAAELEGLLPDDVAVKVRGSLSISTNGGADTVAVDSTGATLLSINTGEDDDNVSLGAEAAEGATLSSLNDSTARVRAGGAVLVNLGAGNDGLNLNNVGSRGAILVWGGEGDNTIDASAVHAAAMTIATDGGVDTVSLTDLDVHHLGLHTGAENDDVEITDSAFTSLGVALGDGNDTLSTGGLEARFALLAGNDGDDTYEELSANMFGHHRITGFEIPPDINSSNIPNRRPLLAELLGRLRRI